MFLLLQKYIGHCSIIVKEYLDPLLFLDKLLMVSARYPAYNEMERPIFCIYFGLLYPSMLINFTENDPYIPRDLFIPRRTKQNSHHKKTKEPKQIFSPIQTISLHKTKQISRIFQPRKR